VTIHLLAAGPDWGTVPDWLAAVGTLAAFAVALRLLAKELAVRREAEEDRRRDQARLISAWLADPEDIDRNVWLMIIATNGSDEPIYGFHAVLVPSESPFTDDPEAGLGQVGTAQFRRETLPPKETTRGMFQVVKDGIVTGVMPGPVSISFTDAAGRRWKRYPDGRLVEPDRPRRRSRKDYMNAWIAGEVDQLDY
jgi:hypothetical protein